MHHGGEGRPSVRVGTDGGAGEALRSTLVEIGTGGARRIVAAALGVEVDGYSTALADERDEHGRRLVVRNGHAQPRQVVTGAGAIPVRAPRVNDKRIDADSGERGRFRSAILAPGARKSPKVSQLLPLM